ncbi:DNA polymerase delta small subunit Cdc1 [Marasmius crinis-equi]|uniref:DNA polymerase delta small subunit Cdc1 n=1 Tax=Marasmius crinis-equi TaxID=585013 RepID=A0ABR3FGJ5_9AGAR
MERISPLPKSSSTKRSITNVLPPPEGTPSFIVTPGQKTYKHQYSQIYYMWLTHLSPLVEERAKKRWKDLDGSPVDPYHHLRPPQNSTLLTTKSCSKTNQAEYPLAGDLVKKGNLVTGVILGALGMETPDSEFQVIDICYAGASPSSSTKTKTEDEMNVDESAPKSPSDSDEWIAAISGLEVGSQSSSDALIHMLVEYLSGEECGIKHSVSRSLISGLTVAGDSLMPLSLNNKGEANVEETTGKKFQKYAQDTTTHLLDLGRTMSIHLLPRESDPSGVILPQQSLPKGMFGAVGSLSSF